MRCHARGASALIGLCVLAVATGLIPTAEAHNPAQTLYEPAAIGDRLLVVGGEGTYAFLDDEGDLETRGNLSGQGELLGAPVVAGDQGAVVVRSYPDLVPHVQAFDGEGPTWRVDVGEAETFAYVLPDGDAFTVFTTDGRQLSLTGEGEIAHERAMPVEPATRPAPATQAGWWIPTSDGIARVVEGEIVDQRDYAGEPTDVTVAGERVLVSLTDRERGLATLMVYDGSLELAFSRSLEALRLGGQPAILEDRLVVGTYDPEGARLVALDDSRGSIVWEQQPPNATAAAPATFEGRIVATTTAGVIAYDEQGRSLWEHGTRPYLDSPAILGDVVVPASAVNSLQALHPNGSVAWSWTDGVETPSWSHHGGADASTGVDGGGEDETQETPLPVVSAPLALLVAFCLRGARRPR